MDDPRTAAYTDLVAGVLAVRTDHASARFDLELARAEAAGTIDADTARTLRWWQRESVRAVADHVTRVLPEVLGEVADADAEAADQVDASADAWATATALAGLGPAGAPRSGEPTAGPEASVTPLTTTAGPGAGSQKTSAAGPSGPFRPQPPEPAGPEPEARSGSTLPARVEGPRAYGSRTTGAPSRRTLVAGLTVLGDERGPDRP